MKKMKKVLALLLAGMMMLAMLTACGGDGSQTPNNGDSQPDAQEPSGGDSGRRGTRRQSAQLLRKR